MRAALAGIDAVFAIEHADTYNADVASQRTCRSSGSAMANSPGLPLAPNCAVAITDCVRVALMATAAGAGFLYALAGQ